jgi:hypothetical protein
LVELPRTVKLVSPDQQTIFAIPHSLVLYEFMPPVADNYHDQTKRPLFALLIAVPLLAVYELSALYSQAATARSGLERWFFSLFDDWGFAPCLIASLASIAIILAWHRRSEDNWRAHPHYVAGMFVESIILGALLFFAAQAVMAANSMHEPSFLSVTAQPSRINSFQWAVRSTQHLGTSVYEEVLFRLLLLSGAFSLLRYFRLRTPLALALAIVLTGSLFSALHYSIWNPAGLEFDWTSFICRCILGMAFGGMFFYRGLGIAVGAHASYNILSVLC